MRFIILSVFLGLIVLAYSSRVTIFEHQHHSGASWYSGDFGHECHNIPGWLNDKASSIHTHGTCAIVCEHAHCTGRCERFAHGTPHHNDFVPLGFDNAGSSIKGC